MRRYVITLIVAAGCVGRSNTETTKAAYNGSNGDSEIEVHFEAPDWAYRLGPELYATVTTDSTRVRDELAHAAAKMGCHAVVSVVIPPDVRGTDRRPWGFCAWRVK